MKMKRLPLSKITRDAVWTRDHLTVKALCPCCEINEMGINTSVCAHKIAVAVGGSNDIDNLISICAGCNSAMGTMSYDEYKNIYHPDAEQRQRNIEIRDVQIKLDKNLEDIKDYEQKIISLITPYQNKILELGLENTKLNNQLSTKPIVRAPTIEKHITISKPKELSKIIVETCKKFCNTPTKKDRKIKPTDDIFIMKSI